METGKKQNLICLLSVLALLVTPLPLAAQLTFTTNNGAITITGGIGNPANLIVPAVTNGYPVSSIGSFAFYGYSALTNVIMGTNVTTIGEAAFYKCANLHSVILPPSVTAIYDNAFAYCSTLTNIALDANITTIDYSAFTECALTSVVIPDGVTDISDGLFYGCANLTNVTIGPNVITIEQAAFYECSNLTGIYFKGDMPTNASPYAFLYDPKATVYYLPGTAGWTNSFDRLPTAFWTLPYPLILNNRPDFGIQTNQFGFTVSWATNRLIIIQVCTNFSNQVWTPIQTNTLSAGVSYFNDPQWTNSPARLYRISSP